MNLRIHARAAGALSTDYLEILIFFFVRINENPADFYHTDIRE